MTHVVWLDSALEDLQTIAAFIAERDPLAAQQLVGRLMDDADALAELPARFRRGRVAGTHELVCHPNYLLVYRHTLSTIEILSVVHARQQYPR